MLDDPMLIDRASTIIRDERLNAESALQRALDEISALFDEAHDRYLRERKGDVADVVGRLRMNLRAGGDPPDLFEGLEGPLVLVADELTPSVIAQLDWQRLAALVTDAGSWTYHTAILARSIHVPAVAGLHDASGLIAPGALVAVDGSTGDVFVEPDADDARADHRAAAAPAGLRGDRSTSSATLPAVTEDGVEIRLEANIESPDDAARALERGAAGIGLFRSEFLLAGGGPAALTEEAQYAAYRRLIESCRARPGHDPHVRRQRDRSCGLASRGGRRRAGAARPARHPSEPGDRRRSSRRSCGRCFAPRSTGRCGSCSRSSPGSRSCARRAPRSTAPPTPLRARGETPGPTSRSAS